MWFRIRSWHILDRWSEVDDAAITLCGRRKYLTDKTLHAEPAENEPTCETCFRVKEKRG